MNADEILSLPDNPEFDTGYRNGWQDGFLVAASVILNDLQFLRKPERIMDHTLRYINSTLFVEWLINGSSSEPPEFDVKCVYCGEPATQLDHVIPRSRGGSDNDSNLVPACRKCNLSKHARTPEEWREDTKKDNLNRSSK